MQKIFWRPPLSQRAPIKFRHWPWVMWLLKEGGAVGEENRWAENALTVCWLQWRWWNDELFNGVRPKLQQKLRMVMNSIEEEGEVFRMKGHTDVVLNKAMAVVTNGLIWASILTPKNN